MRRAGGWALVLLPALAAAAEPRPFGPGLRVAAGMSIDRGGLSADVGVRWAPFAHFGLGLEAEYNPWFDLTSASMAPGVASLVGTGFYRWVEVDGLELRTTVHLGLSVLLFNAVGAPAGSVGGYVGLGALSAMARVGSGSWLEIKPDVVVPVPQLRGVPFAYRQYRLLLGIEWR